LLVIVAILFAIIACALPSLSPTGEPGALETSISATLTAVEEGSGEEVSSLTETPLSPTTTFTATIEPTITVTPTATAPPDGISLNCDGTYQRFRLLDEGASGKSLFIDHWQGDSWAPAWSFEGGDPMIRQIDASAGLYSFGGCQSLLAVPVIYSGSGAVLELSIYAWDGSGMVERYLQDGVHGRWEKEGDTLIFQRSVYLYGEPNCCPCNTEYLEHTWDGIQFVLAESVTEPTHEGEPPDYCQP
jgi:hypothetical protein